MTHRTIDEQLRLAGVQSGYAHCTISKKVLPTTKSARSHLM
jgi:hypothetical protein